MERNIVNKILAISILESVHDQFRPPMERVSIRDLIELVLLQGKYCSEARVALNVPQNTIITSNGAFIFEIMNTLLSNAMTIPPPRKITITSEETDTLFRLSVTDNGVGIPAEKLETVFEPFFISDADKLSRKYGRLGLGLTMARKRASMLGGVLTVTSSSGYRQHVYPFPPAAGTCETVTRPLFSSMANHGYLVLNLGS